MLSNVHFRRNSVRAYIGVWSFDFFFLAFLEKTYFFLYSISNNFHAGIEDDRLGTGRWSEKTIQELENLLIQS